MLALRARKLGRINALLNAMVREPHEGLGKPERLRFDKAGGWSRRIDQAHRVVYRVADGVVMIAALRYHHHAP